MDGWTIGADVATMATGLAAVTAAVAWVRRQWDGWQSERCERKRRNWHGYIDVGGIGVLIWQMPSGRSYSTFAEPCPVRCQRAPSSP